MVLSIWLQKPDSCEKCVCVCVKRSWPPLPTFLIIQLKVTVFISPSDGICHPVPVWVLGMHDGHQSLRTSVLWQKGLIAADGHSEKERRWEIRLWTSQTRHLFPLKLVPDHSQTTMQAVLSAVDQHKSLCLLFLMVVSCNYKVVLYINIKLLEDVQSTKVMNVPPLTSMKWCIRGWYWKLCIQIYTFVALQPSHPSKIDMTVKSVISASL